MKNLPLTLTAVLFLFTLAQAQIKVSCIGNSITAGRNGVSYISKLRTLLGPRYTVQNAGMSGAAMLKASIVSYWNSGSLSLVFNSQPNIITIKLGTNDTRSMNWDLYHADFKRDYLAMIDTLSLLPTQPRIFLVLPTPAWPNTFGIRDSVLQIIIGIIREIALERSLSVIDCNTPLLPFPSYMTDGIHPNDAGCDTIANIIYRAITSSTATRKEPLQIASTQTALPAVGPVFFGNNQTSLQKRLEPGARYKMIAFNLHGRLVSRSIITDHNRSALNNLKQSPGILWVSVKELP